VPEERLKASDSKRRIQDERRTCKEKSITRFIKEKQVSLKLAKKYKKQPLKYSIISEFKNPEIKHIKRDHPREEKKASL